MLFFLNQILEIYNKLDMTYFIAYVFCAMNFKRNDTIWEKI